MPGWLDVDELVDCLKSGPGPCGPGSRSRRSRPGPRIVGPGPAGEWSGPKVWTWSGPGPDLSHVATLGW